MPAIIGLLLPGVKLLTRVPSSGWFSARSGLLSCAELPPWPWHYGSAASCCALSFAGR